MPLLEPLSAQPDGLCTLADVKARLSSSLPGSWADARIAALIPAATLALQARAAREFVPRTVGTRRFTASSAVVDLARSDLVSATAFRLDGADVSPELIPAAGDPLTKTHTAVRLPCRPARPGVLEVEGTWGCYESAEAVPADLKAACVETVLAWLDRGAAQVTGLQPQDARQPFETAALTWDIPLSAIRKLAPYMRDLGAF